MDIPVLTFSRLLLGNLKTKFDTHKNKEQCLTSAINWLEEAHNQTQNNGVSYGYSLIGGWKEPYRETTGYIAVTFFNLSGFFDNVRYAKQALSMCEWLLSVQNADGSVSNLNFNPQNGIVFDTGQVLFGLVRAYEETKDKRFLLAARKAGNWLHDKAADSELRWTKYTYNNIPHAYNTRVAWAVLRLNQIDANSKWVNVARANLDFALEQYKNGWFDQCAFKDDLAPFTHTIAYAIRGLFESACLLDDKIYQKTAESVASSCIDKLSDNGFIPGQINIDGSAIDSYCCLTGNCQLAIVWARMYKLTKNKKYQASAISALNYVRQRQIVNAANKSIHGAIQGSYPIWGRYSMFTFPNWAAKFYIDALLECWDWL